MAVRLRWTGKGWIALCAAEYEAQVGDIYIDDNQDHTLREKYLADYESEGLLNDSGRRVLKLKEEGEKIEKED